MTCDHKADVNVVKLSTTHHLHSPRKKKLIFIGASGVVQKDGKAIDPGVLL
jgi:hypothetical protein